MDRYHKNLNKLPEHAFVDNPVLDPISGHRQYSEADTGVIVITRGEPGYKPFPTRQSADALNAQFNVSIAQREAMLAGSMFGYHVPAADPDHPSNLNESMQSTQSLDECQGMGGTFRQ